MKKEQDIINAMTAEELDKALLKRKEYRKEKYPIIHLTDNKEVSYRVVENEVGEVNGKGYYLQFKWWQDEEWIDVTDLSELKVWEYNELVDKLNKHYPDYPIEYLEGRFV